VPRKQNTLCELRQLEKLLRQQLTAKAIFCVHSNACIKLFFPPDISRFLFHTSVKVFTVLWIASQLQKI
jgi:hypothetical protein